MSKTRQTLVNTGIVLAVTLAIAGCAQPKEAQNQETTSKPSPGIVQLTSDAARKGKIQLLTISTAEVQREFKTLGEVKANDNRVFHISSLASGKIANDNVTLGDVIRQGQVLAAVQNLEVVKIQASSLHELHANEVSIQQTKSKLRLAQKTLDREKRLVAEGIAPRKDLFQAESDAEIAKAELAGLQEHNVHIRSEGRALLNEYGMQFNPRTEKLQSRSPIVSPRAGVITKKNITAGDVISSDQVLYEVADLSQVWLDLTIYPQDLKDIRVGQVVRFISDSLPGKSFTGRINYIPPIGNTENQTFIARAYLSNPSLLLKPGMFGQAVIERNQSKKMVFIPEEAVQKYAKETFVFIPQGGGRYKKQDIVLGEQTDKGYFVQSGLEEGDVVVGAGSFSLKAEMLKSQFGEE
jgi:membrane fusion protein, heavy metal efflux system